MAPNRNDFPNRPVSAEGIAQLTDAEKKKYLDMVSKSVGGGGFYNTYQTFFSGIDRYHRNMLPPNVEHTGLTFITRPRLCLRSGSLRSRAEFAPLDTLDPRSMGYAIKCMMDTKYCIDFKSHVSKCGLIDPSNPFFVPLMNGLQSVTGFPDPVVQTLTTDAGFHSEDQTFATGYDQLSKTYDLNLTFKDIQNGPLAAIFFFWMMYMGYVTKGMMPAYQDDIEAQRMNYTVSIYRFILDPSKKYITKYAKATGCFPRSAPFGAIFNYGEAEIYNTDSGKFTVPFVANKIEYGKYTILQDFNMLVNRYRRVHRKPVLNEKLSYVDRTYDPHENFKGSPWIDTSGGRIRLVFVNY
jgi:hypothetical protein